MLSRCVLWVPENVLWHLGGSVPRLEGLATWCMGTEQRTGQGRGPSVGTHSGSRVEPEVEDRRGEERFEQWQHLNCTLKDRFSINGEGGSAPS